MTEPKWRVMALRCFDVVLDIDLERPERIHRRIHARNPAEAVSSALGRYVSRLWWMGRLGDHEDNTIFTAYRYRVISVNPVEKYEV